jgi:glycosyltransferase involved in cell wall biosynthesis
MNDTQKKFSVTVGIPAYNEELNILYTLQSVVKQAGQLFTLEKIRVISDGSTDKTEEIVKAFSREHPMVELVADQERKGKITRLNQLCRMNESDFLIFLDADTVFESENAIEEAIRVFRGDEDVNVVAMHEIPVKAETFVERINNAGCHLWDETRLFINGGNHIHNLRGSGSVVRKKFADTLEFPVRLTTDASFLYLKAIENNPDGFRYAYKAHILYHSPNSLDECRIQGSRSIFDQKSHVSNYFGNWVFEKYRIPTKYKVRAVLKRMIQDPVFTTLAILLGVYVRLFPLKDEMVKKYTWKIVRSTKRSLKNASPDFKMKEVY